MFKRLLICIIPILILVSGCGIQKADTMTIRINWISGNCDLCIREPNGREFWVIDRLSTNGVFSPDAQNGGAETWTLNAKHADGDYTPLARSLDYTGPFTLAVIYNGMKTSITTSIKAGETIVSTDFLVRR